jgi:hypothetical protein
MRKFALALATAAALGLAVPAMAASDNTQAPAVKLAQADVKVKVDSGKRVKKKVVVRHDRGRHLGWHKRDRGCKTVIIKKRSGNRVVVKRIKRCR